MVDSSKKKGKKGGGGAKVGRDHVIVEGGHVTVM